MIKHATFYSKHSQLQYWDSNNTTISGYCKGLKQAKMTLQMIKATRGVEQDLIVVSK